MTKYVEIIHLANQADERFLLSPGDDTLMYWQLTYYDTLGDIFEIRGTLSAVLEELTTGNRQLRVLEVDDPIRQGYWTFDQLSQANEIPIRALPEYVLFDESGQFYEVVLLDPDKDKLVAIVVKDSLMYPLAEHFSDDQVRLFTHVVFRCRLEADQLTVVNAALLNGAKFFSTEQMLMVEAMRDADDQLLSYAR